MIITEVTASWTETANLGNYSNVKPSLTLTAQLAEDDNPHIVAEQLLLTCRAQVQDLVDQALESMEEPARYSTDPRFDVWSTQIGPRSVYIIAPSGAQPELEIRSWRATSRQRFPAAQRYADQRANVVIVADGSDMASVAAQIDHLREEDKAKRAVEAKRAAPIGEPELPLYDDDAADEEDDD